MFRFRVALGRYPSFFVLMRDQCGIKSLTLSYNEESQNRPEGLGGFSAVGDCSATPSPVVRAEVRAEEHPTADRRRGQRVRWDPLCFSWEFDPLPSLMYLLLRPFVRLSSATPIETFHRWVIRADIDAGQRNGLTTEEREELRTLRRENRVLREERDILKKAAAGSRGRCNDRAEPISWRLVRKGLARPRVELHRDGVQLALVADRQVGLPREPRRGPKVSSR